MAKRSIRKSLAQKLSFAILVLGGATFVVSVGYLFLQSRQAIHQEVVERATSLLSTTSLRVSHYLNEIEIATDNFDWQMLQNMNPDSLLTYSRSVVQLNPHVNGCSIATEPFIFPQYGRNFSAYSVREGDSVMTVREVENEYFKKVWYKTPVTLGHACWVDLFDDYNDGTLSSSDMIVSYCKPLYNNKERLVGVISTDLSLSRLSKVISVKKPYPNSYFVMLGKQGHYFVHPDSTRLVNQTIFTGVNPHDHPDIIELGHNMIQGKRGNMKVFIDGKPCLVCFQPQPHTDWSLALVCPESDIFRNYIRLGYVILALVVCGLMAILLLCRRAVKRIIAPIQQLVDLSQSIAACHYDTPIPHSPRKDAIGRLQNNCAAMQQSLASYMNNIEQANEETARRNDELQKASKLAQESSSRKKAFMQDMTHQIRTPLNIIMGFSQILRDDARQMSDEEVDSIMAMIEHNTVTITRMAAMLYDSSEQGTVGLECNDDVSCNAAARESIDDACRQFPGTLCVEFHTTIPDTLTIRTNKLYLFRCLRELLYNAAKYSDGQHTKCYVSANDTAVQFVIEDCGPGISDEERELLFSPFTKTNNLSEGLGLGLPLTKRHCRNMGGDLTLDSSYHDGCRFVIELPLKGGHTQEQTVK